MKPQFPGCATILDANTISFTRYIPVSPERTWRAITLSEERSRWFLDAQMDLRVGGEFRFGGGWRGRIGEMQPIQCIRFDTSENSFTRMELSPNWVGTEFHLIDKLSSDAVPPEDLPSIFGVADEVANGQPGGVGTHWVGIVVGWHHILDNLKSYLTNAPMEADVIDLFSKYEEVLGSHWEERGTH